MIPISEKSSGGALVDWVPEGHDRKYTEPAAMSIRIAATDQHQCSDDHDGAAMILEESRQKLAA
jgi:hypothetical protein